MADYNSFYGQHLRQLGAGPVYLVGNYLVPTDESGGVEQAAFYFAGDWGRVDPAWAAIWGLIEVIAASPAVGGYAALTRIAHHAGGHNQSDVIDWLASLGCTYDITPAFYSAAQRGCLDVLRAVTRNYLAQIFQLHPERRAILATRSFTAACKGGQLRAARFLSGYFAIGPQGASCGEHLPFRHACAGGHVELVKWLLFGIGIQPQPDVWDAVASAATKAGHTKIVQVLLQARSALWMVVMAAAAEVGSYTCVQVVISTCSHLINPEQIRIIADYAQKKGHPELANQLAAE